MRKIEYRRVVDNNRVGYEDHGKYLGKVNILTLNTTDEKRK